MAKKTYYLKFGDDLFEIIPPFPTEEERGGIIASPKESTDTVEVKLGGDGKLYAPAYPDLTDINETTTGLQSQIDTLNEIASNKADKDHNHDEVYDEKGSAENALNEAKLYADSIKTEIETSNEEQFSEINELLQALPSDKVIHNNLYLLSEIIETYLLNIDYESLLSFDTTDVVIDSTTSSSTTTSMLGKAILGRMILA